MNLATFTFKMAASDPTSFLPSMSLQANITSQVSSPRGSLPATVQSGGGDTNVFPEAGKVREMALQLHGCLFQAQQLKMAAVQQQPSAPASQQIAQAEEISSRLKAAILHLQEAAHDSSLVGLQDRFSAMAAKLDLKYDEQFSAVSKLSSLFLMCDAYYVEICCQDDGYVASVKLAQANKQVDSEVLTQLLRASKFSEFESHMYSLKEFYAQSSSSNEATNMYRVLTSIESMLLCITKVSPPQASLSDVILNNPLGHVIPRNAGLPMKLLFFVHPYQILESPLLSSSPSHQLHEVGVSAKLLLESSSKMYPLSVDPNLFDVSKATFFPITPQNSVNISVNYVLHISKEIPVCEAIRRDLHKTVYPKENFQSVKGPHINQLIAVETANSHGVKVCTSKSRVVCLPSQRHYYSVPAELKSGDLSHDPGHPAVMMKKVSFLHPVHIFSIVTLLRKQLVYNSLVASVLGRNPKEMEGGATAVGWAAAVDEVMFKVTTHPAEKVIVEVDLQSQRKEDYLSFGFIIRDHQPTSPLVNVKVGKDGSPAINQKLSLIVKKSMSIPVTLYAVIKCPQLLGEDGKKLFQGYLHNIRKFNTELSGGVKGHTDSATH